MDNDDIVDAIETNAQAPQNSPRPRCQAILNGLIRSYKAPRQGEQFHFVKAVGNVAGGGGKVQIDHFFEIQHVIKMLFEDGGPFSPANNGELAALSENLFSWVTLSVWMNDAQNLYPVKESFNQAKKKLRLAVYWPGGNQNPDLKDYLAADVQSTIAGAKRVGYNLRNWAASMAMYGNEPDHYVNHRLVAFIGAKICERMGWDWIKMPGWRDPSHPWH